MQGQIIKISSNLHYVEQNGTIYPCIPRGKFRKQHVIPRVGDYVVFDKDQKVIEDILPRKNEFDRPFVSNIDQAFIVTSLKQPDFSLALLDRFLVLMELHHTTSIICITKEDLLTKEEKNKIHPFLTYYQKIGYPVISNQDLVTIKKMLALKTSVFTGQTGVGKSTLLNHLNKNWKIETGEISLALGRGRHTTRTVGLYPFQDGKVLDTPGFSALSFKEYTKQEIREAFIEFKKYPCPYQDCTHTKEKECRIKEEVEKGVILKSRYESYLRFVEEGRK
ncbi:MAG TPA: ribosome small subunit-dependent GTPase A [Candidatus Onthousia faecigallinarum]|nr:ribosome small subunit-dependent GTPase A [Candidatus Onthousia faecigallinarum]